MSVIEDIKKEFPDIQSVEIKATISTAGIDNTKRPFVVKDGNIPSLIPCGNSECRDGGFDSWLIIRNAIKTNLMTGSETCDGDEHMTKMDTRSCCQMIDYEIMVQKRVIDG